MILILEMRTIPLMVQLVWKSSVRGVYQLGGNPRPIDYITFSTTGNAQDFGDLATNYGTPAGASNAVRGVYMGGGNNNNNINFITISTLGDAQDFGDLTAPRFEIVGLGSPTRAVDLQADHKNQRHQILLIE